MADNLEIINSSNLTEATTSDVENGEVLIVVNYSQDNVRRAPANKMKGPKGDKMAFSDLTASDIAVLQQPANNMIAELQKTNTAVNKNETARTQAESTRVQAESGRVTAESERVQAEQNRESSEQAREGNESQRITNEAERIENEDERIDAEQIRASQEDSRQTQERDRQTNTTTAITNAENATDRLTKLSDNLPEIRDGYWWRWNEQTDEYENTGEKARGDVMYATFEMDFTTGQLVMVTPVGYEGVKFELNQTDGCLYSVIEN